MAEITELSKVLGKIEKKYKKGLLDQAVSIFTPFPDKKPLADLNLSKNAIDFIRQYEPKAEESGLFFHQFNLLDEYSKDADNFILTSSTGSGKSLCFWTWIIDKLTLNPNATAIICFPTQALMWGQADRLARISTDKTYYNHNKENAFSGNLNFNNKKIGWTIWKGVGYGWVKDKDMKEHEGTDNFKKSRIRLATLDKAHWSLITGHVNFTKNLECIVLDEAHQYDGLFGANVHYFLKRVYIAKESSKRKRPNIFLASATLSDAKSFASRLISYPEDEIYHVTDLVNPQINSIALNEVQNLLENPPKDGLLRINLFIDSLNKNYDLTELINNPKIIGNSLNLLYFSNSKYESRILKKKSKKSGGRRIEIYDGDLPPERRRHIEKLFNELEGSTLLATNALELGVDIENLELCLLNTIPPKRVDLIQRVGRVGRRAGLPGVTILKLSAAPLDRFIVEDPERAFSFDSAVTIPLPTDLRLNKLKNMEAIHYAGCYKKYAAKNWPYYQKVFKKYFGEFLKHEDIKEIINRNYAGLIDTQGNQWVYKGFRASASERKIPIRILNSDEDVAWIEDINIFRDAHPEAVYLDDNGHHWRVKYYDGDWKIAEWTHPESPFKLGKYLKTISVVYVEKEDSNRITRGSWDDTIEEYQIFPELPEETAPPANGKLEYGIWEYTKKFDGYTEYNLDNNETIKVSLKEVSDRFKKLLEQGINAPFLYPLSYRTYGWSWKFKGLFEDMDDDKLKEMEPIIGEILEAFFADSVQSKASDIQTDLSLKNTKITVLDTTPAGNGLSEALLKQDNVNKAFNRCIETLNFYTQPEMRSKFKSYILELCEEEVKHEPSELSTIIQRLQNHWQG